MTITPDGPQTPTLSAIDAADLPYRPDRVLSSRELLDWVRELADRPELWSEYVAHDTVGRHYVSLYRDADIDVWLLCWNLADDTGWHDHDTSSGAVVVTRGAVTENRLRFGSAPSTRRVEAGRAFAFGADHIHRMAGAMDGAVSIHAYSPPLWRMGQYSISRSGVMRRTSVSYADELRPLDG